jgi:UDP-3-O-[3-hydroxymyristoyl] glucosamine N-acyltransferase
MKLSELARVAPIAIRNDGDFESLGLLRHSHPRMLVMYFDAGYAADVRANGSISAVITTPELAAQIERPIGIAVCDDPVAAFYAIHHYLLAETDFYGCAAASDVAADAVIDPTACVAARGVRIGSRTVLGPRSVIQQGSSLGSDVIIGPGVVIGGEGFEPKRVAGRKIIVRHAGGVEIGDRVEIQANSHVARALFNGATLIAEDTKLDALVHVAHNARIGRRCELAAMAVVSGSTTIGDDVWIGPNATISSELRVGDGAFVAIGSVVIKDVPAGQRVFGVPAKPLRSLE